MAEFKSLPASQNKISYRVLAIRRRKHSNLKLTKTDIVLFLQLIGGDRVLLLQLTDLADVVLTALQVTFLL